LRVSQRSDNHIFNDDVSSEGETPTGLLVRDCAGERPSEVVYHRRGSAGSRLAPADVRDEYVAGARLVHVSGVTGLLGDGPRAAAAKAMRIARQAGALVSFDPNVRRRRPPDRGRARRAAGRRDRGGAVSAREPVAAIVRRRVLGIAPALSEAVSS
jgi:sugar/nucleoside kinase (ribokinase family)